MWTAGTGTGSLGSGATPVPCLYADHPTNASSLCELWCNIAAYSGLTCSAGCPYRWDRTMAVV